jgi:hypothetical protein
MSSSRWLQFRVNLTAKWSRFWNRLMKDESVDQPPTVRMALGHFRRTNQDDDPAGK